MEASQKLGVAAATMGATPAALELRYTRADAHVLRTTSLMRSALSLAGSLGS